MFDFFVNIYMNDFDDIYEEEMRILTEGAFKNIATAGMLGLGALGADNAVADHNTRPPIQKKVTDDFILNKTLPLTKWAEGFRESVYKDSKGILSVGYGFNLNSPHIIKELENFGYSSRNLMNRNEVITERDAEAVLKRLMAKSLQDAKQFVTNFDQLDPIAQIVVIDMSYNLGLTRLSKFKRFKSALERLDYDSAWREMEDSAWYSQVGRRSKRLVQLVKTIADRS